MISDPIKERLTILTCSRVVADLSVGVLSVLTDIVWRLTITWDAGLLACKTIKWGPGQNLTYTEQTYIEFTGSTAEGICI